MEYPVIFDVKWKDVEIRKSKKKEKEKRFYSLPYNSRVMYWGIFISILFHSLKQSEKCLSINWKYSELYCTYLKLKPRIQHNSHCHLWSYPYEFFQLIRKICQKIIYEIKISLLLMTRTRPLIKALNVSLEIISLLLFN